MKPGRGGYSGHRVVQFRCGKYGLVHRMVLEAFVGPCPPEMHQCRHLDGNPANNHVSNLKWGTKRENALDRETHGTMAKGQRIGTAKLKDADIPVIMQLVKERVPQKEIGKRFGVSHHTIRAIPSGNAWNHITGIPRPARITNALARRRVNGD